MISNGILRLWHSLTAYHEFEKLQLNLLYLKVFNRHIILGHLLNGQTCQK